ncbi:hypothetical protein [Streptomyces sp. BE133]|uniref:hypothetical protein n=1 Tax=Streptomyces sp. BE133 TaxID=3002523 RepID=UPI002E763A5C|nr:hypothetical protein [Streptomyces sp. BE133]MEE1805412.1 hypothetical protein [Streptomyces sp. BE133]
MRWARWAGRRPLTPERAEVLGEAVRHAGRLWPGRAASMETSLGTAMARPGEPTPEEAEPHR